jgi:hypothetical protein
MGGGKLGNFWRQQRKAKNALYIGRFHWGCVLLLFFVVESSNCYWPFGHIGRSRWEFCLGKWTSRELDNTAVVHMLLRRWMDTGYLEGMDAAEWMDGRICNETAGEWTIILVEEAWAAGPFYWLKTAVTSSTTNSANLFKFRHLVI